MLDAFVIAEIRRREQERQQRERPRPTLEIPDDDDDRRSDSDRAPERDTKRPNTVIHIDLVGNILN